MKCMIESLLDEHRDHLSNKSTNVIARFVKIKLHIDMSLNAMQRKIDVCLKKQCYQ